MTDAAATSHKILVSVAVLIGGAFVFQGVAASSPAAHNVVLALLVGVVLILGINLGVTGKLGALANYPYLPAAPATAPDAGFVGPVRPA